MARVKRDAGGMKAQHEKARAATVEKILNLLAGERLSAPELSRATRVEPNTLNGYLRYMQRTLRKARPTTMRRAKAALWELGADPSLPSEDEILERLIAPKRGIRPAVQIGIPRDPLIAALFGPANQEHKEAA